MQCQSLHEFHQYCHNLFILVYIDTRKLPLHVCLFQQVAPVHCSVYILPQEVQQHTAQLLFREGI